MPDQTVYFKKTPEDNPGGRPVCDLCGDPDQAIVAAYPARAFVMSVITDGGSFTQDYNSDGWAACSWCAPLIEAGDLPRLVERYFVVHPLPDGLLPADRAFMRGLVSTQYELFFEHRDGEPTPYAPAAPPA